MTGELENLRDCLSQYRETLKRKCAGLTPEQMATRSVSPSSLSLLGLVRHMAYVEHAWFQRALQAFEHTIAGGNAEALEKLISQASNTRAHWRISSGKPHK